MTYARIDRKEIKKHIAELLTCNGFTVTASELEEGFPKPSAFVSVFPSTVELQGPYLESVSDTVEIKYIPAAETVEHCVDAAEKIQRLFLYTPFEVADRKFTIQSMEFDIEKYILFVWFDIEYTQEKPDRDEEYDLMEDYELELGGVSNGIT